MTLYPLTASLDDVFDEASAVVPDEWTLARNVLGIEVRPRGIDKAIGLRHIASLLSTPLTSFAGVGDSDPDLNFLRACAFGGAPANATPAVREAAHYVSPYAYGEGLLDILNVIDAAA